MEQEVKGKVVVKTKKETILSLFDAGVKDVEVIARIAGSRPSYVGSVLQREGLIDNYFDLYTSTNLPMNVYSKHFQGRLGFKDVDSARRSVSVLDSAYRYFDNQQDRAGQHHTLEMGLTMLDRARWTGKLEEAEVYRQWMMRRLSTPLVDNTKPAALRASVPQPAEQAEVAQPEFKLAA